MQALRRTFPCRPAPDTPDPGILETLKDSASAVTCGGLAGMFMWACILPLDVAKTRIQTAYPVRPSHVAASLVAYTCTMPSES